MALAESSTAAQPTIVPREAQSGLDAWKTRELPVPPSPRGLSWIGTLGPGVIVLGASIGSGEFLLGPAEFVKYGLTLLWVTGIAAFLQTVFNTELMRYTLATGEPAFTGFMRIVPTRPSGPGPTRCSTSFRSDGPDGPVRLPEPSSFCSPASWQVPPKRTSCTSSGSRRSSPASRSSLFGRRIERTLEILNGILVVFILGGSLALALWLVSPATWVAAAAGFVGFDPRTGGFTFLPPGADFFLLGAFAAYSGAGGMINVTLSNWARDKGYGMAGVVGYIPAAVGGKPVRLAHTGYKFIPDRTSMERWRGWWRIVRVDQWGIYFTGAVLGIVFPALLYVTYIPTGTEIRGLGVAAALAEALGRGSGPLLGLFVAFLGGWILFNTQLDILDGLTRAINDILWTGSGRIRAARGADVRVVYYAVLAVVVIWGIIALRLTQPIILLPSSAPTWPGSCSSWPLSTCST